MIHLFRKAAEIVFQITTSKKGEKRAKRTEQNPGHKQQYVNSKLFQIQNPTTVTHSTMHLSESVTESSGRISKFAIRSNSIFPRNKGLEDLNLPSTFEKNSPITKMHNALCISNKFVRLGSWRSSISLSFQIAVQAIYWVFLSILGSGLTDTKSWTRNKVWELEESVKQY